MIVGFDMGRAGFGDPGGEFRRRIAATILICGARLAEQPRLGERLVTAADDDDHAPLHPHEDGKGIELGGRCVTRRDLLEFASCSSSCAPHKEGMHSRGVFGQAIAFPVDR